MSAVIINSGRLAGHLLIDKYVYSILENKDQETVYRCVKAKHFNCTAEAIVSQKYSDKAKLMGQHNHNGVLNYDIYQSKNKGERIIINGYQFRFKYISQNKTTTYWLCVENYLKNCSCRAAIHLDCPDMAIVRGKHDHKSDFRQIRKNQRPKSSKKVAPQETMENPLTETETTPVKLETFEDYSAVDIPPVVIIKQETFNE